MDNLARNAMLAKQAGMSYGQWKAMQKPVPIVKKAIPDGWKACAWCGEPFMPKQGKKFCDINCQRKAQKERNRKRHTEYMREYRARKG